MPFEIWSAFVYFRVSSNNPDLRKLRRDENCFGMYPLLDAKCARIDGSLTMGFQPRNHFVKQVLSI